MQLMQLMLVDLHFTLWLLFVHQIQKVKWFDDSFVKDTYTTELHISDQQELTDYYENPNISIYTIFVTSKLIKSISGTKWCLYFADKALEFNYSIIY